MAQIPKAEEVFKTFQDKYKTSKPRLLNAHKSSMIEFAKLHVEAALKAASKKAKIKSRKIKYKASHGVEYNYITSIDKQTILNAYPEINIK